MRIPHADYQLDDTLSRLDFPRIHQWLSSTYWWREGITRELVNAVRRMQQRFA